jgi:hypothetical protein
MKINYFFKNTNLKRGFTRLLAIASIGFFSWGAYFDFSPTTWLYGKTNYSDVVQRATLDLKDESCLKTNIDYAIPIDEPNNIIYLVCENEAATLCIPTKKCNGILDYAEIVGKERIGKGINTRDLTNKIIENDINKVKSDRRIAMIKERTLSGFDNLLKLWIYVVAFFVFFYASRWIYKGFSSN